MKTKNNHAAMFIDRLNSDYSTHYHQYVGLEIIGSLDYADDGHQYYTLNDIREGKGAIVLENETFNLSYDRHNNGGGIFEDKELKKYKLRPYKKNPKSLADTHALFKRYMTISELFLPFSKPTDISIYGKYANYEDREALLTSYQKEKQTFIDDPYLALYWLIYFALTADNLFKEVKSIILENNLDDKLTLIKEPLDFFDDKDLFKNILNLPVPDKEEEFLHKWATMVWLSQSYQHVGGENNVKQWLIAVLAYTNIDSNLIQRVRWLKNNLTKFNQWSEFEKLEKSENKAIPLMSYVYACNPNSANAKKDADNFVEEITQNKGTLKTKLRMSFVQIMLWDIRDIVTQNTLFDDAVKHYFKTATDSDEYADILKAQGKNTDSLNQVTEATKKVKAIYEKKSVNNSAAYKEISQVFNDLDDETLGKVISNITPIYWAANDAFEYIFLSERPNKKEILTSIFLNQEIRSDRRRRLKGSKGSFSDIIKGENDGNFSIVASWLWLKKEDFSYAFDLDDDDSPFYTVCALLLKAAHEPYVAKVIIERLNAEDILKTPEIIYALFSNDFFNESEKPNPLKKMESRQAESLLETTLHLINQVAPTDETYVGTLLKIVTSLQYFKTVNKKVIKKWINSKELKELYGEKTYACTKVHTYVLEYLGVPPAY